MIALADWTMPRRCAVCRMCSASNMLCLERAMCIFYTLTNTNINLNALPPNLNVLFETKFQVGQKGLYNPTKTTRYGWGGDQQAKGKQPRRI